MKNALLLISMLILFAGCSAGPDHISQSQAFGLAWSFTSYKVGFFAFFIIMAALYPVTKWLYANKPIFNTDGYYWWIIYVVVGIVLLTALILLPVSNIMSGTTIEMFNRGGYIR